MATSELEKLKALKQMLDEGAITQSEFAQMKLDVLQQPVPEPAPLPQRTVVTPTKKRWWVVPVMVGGIILVAGGGTLAGKYLWDTHQVATISHPKKSMKKTAPHDPATQSASADKHHEAAQSSSEKAETSSSETQKMTTVGWAAVKQASLASMMADWQAEMGQQYQGTYNNQVVDHLGFKFPDAIQNGELDGRIAFNQVPVKVVWDPDGHTAGDYQVVAAASGIIPGQMTPTTYLFVIDHDKPVVYMTQTSNGDVLQFTPTANADLQTRFEQLVDTAYVDESAQDSTSV